MPLYTYIAARAVSLAEVTCKIGSKTCVIDSETYELDFMASRVGAVGEMRPMKTKEVLRWLIY